MRTIRAADLFCGAGGTSTGLYEAADVMKARVDLLAVNHWPVAIATHSKNHKLARHMCQTLDAVNPREVVPGGKLDLLVASPECTHHSNARGGRPMNDQSRASAWHVIRWAEALWIDSIIVENVKEFRTWGPLGADGRPLKRRRGETFGAWVKALESLNYRVEYRVLNAADYGAATTRERLFVIAKRNGRAIAWPTPSHSKDGGKTLFGETRKWRAAREILDWTDKGTSIFNRKRPLSPNTIRRIAVGLRKFSNLDLEPFLVKLYGTSTAAPVGSPVPTVTGSGQHLGVVQPFQIRTDCSGGKTAGYRSIDDPAATVVGSGGLGVVEPFVLGQQSGAVARKVDEPTPTVSGKGAISKVEPFLVAHFGEREGQEPRTHSVDQPAPTVTHRGAGDLVQPFIAEFHGGPDAAQRVKSTEDPLPTQTTEPRFGLAQASFVVPQTSSGAPRSTENPIPTVTTTSRGVGLAQPFIMSAGGPEVGPRSTEDPAPTILTRDHLGNVTPVIVGAGGPTGAGKPQSVEDPLNTVLAENHKALVEPFVMPVTHQDASDRTRSVDLPLPTVTTAKRGEIAVIDAFMVQYNGTADARSVDQPIGALTGKPRYALLVVFQNGERYILDILFRMLKPRELARAQGFPDWYEFTGTGADVVKQIGNAVEKNVSKALCLAALAR